MSQTIIPEKPAPTITLVTAPYWEAARQRLLLLQRCHECGAGQHYPRALCARCWSQTLHWAEPSGAGRVWTFTIVHKPGHPAWEGDVPYIVAIVELDEGPRILTNLVGVPLTDVAVGMRVTAAFEQRSDHALVQFTAINGKGSSA